MVNDVYVVSTTNFFGGGESFQIKLAALMQGHVRVVVISPVLPALQSGLAEFGAGFVEMAPREGLALRWAMVRWLWRQRKAIRANKSPVVLNGRGAAYLAPLVRVLSGSAPLVISHTTLSMRLLDFKELLYGMAARFARCVVAVSDSVAAQHHQRWPSLEVKSIPNWIDLCDSAPVEERHDFRSISGKLDVAVVSRLARGKGVEDIVAACSGENGVELHIYGDGPMAAPLYSVSSQFSWVLFHGHVDDLARRLPSHSMLISGSHTESFSYAVAEGIQAGLLCVVTDIPAHREMLGGDYPEALFFPPGDQAALRRSLQAARALLSNGSGEAARGAISRARDRIAMRNSPERARQRYLAVFATASVEDGSV